MLATDDNLYSITGRRIYKLSEFEQPLGKGWHIIDEIKNPQISMQKLKPLVDFIDNFAVPENLPTLIELAGHVSKKLEGIAKAKGITNTEIFKQLMEDNLETLRKTEGN